MDCSAIAKFAGMNQNIFPLTQMPLQLHLFECQLSVTDKKRIQEKNFFFFKQEANAKSVHHFSDYVVT